MFVAQFEDRLEQFLEGRMNEEEQIQFIQRLINSGQVWASPMALQVRAETYLLDGRCLPAA